MPAFQRKTPVRVRPKTKRLRQVVTSDPVLMTEHEVQREFVKWFRQTLPTIRIFAIPNGGSRSKAQGARLKVEGVSRAALKDPACCDRFKVALRAIRPPLWSMSVDDHEQYAAGAVRQAARSAFGKPARRPRREHIDDAAWALICDRRTVKTWCVCRF